MPSITRRISNLEFEREISEGGLENELGRGRSLETGSQVEAGSSRFSEGDEEKHNGEVSVNWLSPSDLSQPINSVWWNTHTLNVDSQNKDRWRLCKWVEGEGGRGGENEKKKEKKSGGRFR